MATETQIRVTRARYGGFMATFHWRGDWCRIFFENQLDLAQELVDAEVDRETRDAVIDTYEQLEWNETPEYPLGVSYRPVAEAAAYEIPYEGDYYCDCETCRSFPVKERKPAGAVREGVIFWLKGMFWIGAVIVPWFAILNAAKWAGVL